MARIRSVHPELFTDEGFCSLSAQARLLYIGIWTLCDDHGVFEWKPFGMKINLLPVDNADVAALLGELTEQQQVKRFEAEGKTYGAVRNFCRFQSPKKIVYKHPFPAELAPYVALERRRTASVPSEAAPTKPVKPAKPPRVAPKEATRGEKPPLRRGEEGREGEGRGVTKTDSESVVVVVGDTKAEATTTTTKEKAPQGKARGLSALIGTPLPADWVPDDETCRHVLEDFGMTLADVNAELPAFHALNVSNGTLSQNWAGTFYMFSKRWKERQARAAPRVEVSKKPAERFVPTAEQWESAVKFYARIGKWPRDHGPDPESPACQCPPEILEAHLPNPAAIPVLAKRGAVA